MQPIESKMKGSESYQNAGPAYESSSNRYSRLRRGVLELVRHLFVLAASGGFEHPTKGL